MTNPPMIPFISSGELFNLTPRVGHYSNGHTAIRLMDEVEGPFCTLTINLPGEHLNEGELFVKDWSENYAVVRALLEAGWLVPTGREVLSGYAVPKVMRPAGPLLEFLS